MDVFDFEIKMTWKAYECVFGALGFSVPYDATSNSVKAKDFLDCEWRSYE